MSLYVSTNVASPTAPFADLWDDAAWTDVKQRLQKLATQAKSANANGLALRPRAVRSVDESMWSMTYPGNTPRRHSDENQDRENALARSRPS